MSRIEIAVGVNRFAAEIVAALHHEEDIELEDLRALSSRRPAGAWWPPAVEAFGCLAAGSAYAPFFIAWDRPGAPPVHRRDRVAEWYGFRDGEQAWGTDVPSILVVCSGEAESIQWEEAVLASAERRRTQPLPILLAEVEAVFSADPLEAVWRRAGSSVESPLVDRLAWRWTMPAEWSNPSFVGPLTAEPLSGLPDIPITSTGLNDRGPAASLGATEKRLVEWIGFHALLSDEELGVLLRLRPDAVRTLLGRLAASAVVDCVQRPAEGEPYAAARYFLTEEGLRLLALRHGVPPRRYARHASAAASLPGWRGDGRLQTLLRQFDHTVGVNRLAVRLSKDARPHGFQVVRWLSASEAAQRFEQEGTIHWLRPDAVVDLSYQGRVTRLYIEWDRGTMSWPEMREKLRVYAAYYGHLLGRDAVAALPVTLVVTSSPQREEELRKVLEDAFAARPEPRHLVLISCQPLVERLGPFGRCWRCSGAGARIDLLEALQARAPEASGQGGDRWPARA